MRESCEAFRKAQALNPSLQRCLGVEVQTIRPPSGHGAKVCEPCGKRNRNEQRMRENAQKRARRAKLKKNKMTAGIGAGNVVWSPPNTWTPSNMDAQNLALHSPQAQRKGRPRGPHVLSVRSMTQAQRQYGLNGSVSTAMMAQRHVNLCQHERDAHLESRQLFAATMSNVLHPPENGHDRIITDIHHDADLHHHYNKTGPKYLPTPEPDIPLPTPKLDVPLYQEQQHQPIGLGVTIPNDAKQEQSHTETCVFKEWSFRMELNEWSTVFDDDDGPDDTKEL